MKKRNKPLMTLLISAIIALTSLNAFADGKESFQCRDIELEKACIEALKSADDLILEQAQKSKYLETQLNLAQSQNETLQKILVDAQNPPWYSKKETVFIIGLITGMVIIKESK